MANEIIDIQGLAYGGDGVGRLADGRVAFVAGALPGDRVDARFADAGDRFVRAQVSGIEAASPHRVDSACALACDGTCGGCPWAQLAYDEQLSWKRQFVVDALRRIAKMDADAVERLVAPCVASKHQWNYRNKVEFEAGQDVAGRLALGMHARGGSFTPLSACKLCASKLEKAPKALTGALRYVSGGQDLGFVRIGVRSSQRTGSVEIALWTRTGRFPRANAAKVVSSSLPAKQLSVTRVLLKGSAKERKVAGVESLAGHGHWSEQLLGRTMMLSAPSFFQVNTRGAEKLVELVLDGLQPDGLDTVLDLYSGAGTFTLPLAAAAREVLAVEAEGSSVRDLRRNLEKNQVDAVVIGGDVGRELTGLGQVDKVVVDPPRSGLAPAALKGLLACGARDIAYVSCNPTTLARDLVGLRDGGYELASVTPVDLFPQTYHVETVAILTRR